VGQCIGLVHTIFTVMLHFSSSLMFLGRYSVAFV
jgi:hypothetical protein